MPSNFWESAKRLGEKAFGGGSQEWEGKQRISPTDTETTNSPIADSHAIDLHADSADTSHKRGADASEAKRPHRSAREWADEGRLIGDYHVPSNATLIKLPTNDDRPNMSSKGQPRPTARSTRFKKSKTGAVNHHAMNTLHSWPLAVPCVRKSGLGMFANVGPDEVGKATTDARVLNGGGPGSSLEAERRGFGVLDGNGTKTYWQPNKKAKSMHRYDLEEDPIEHEGKVSPGIVPPNIYGPPSEPPPGRMSYPGSKLSKADSEESVIAVSSGKAKLPPPPFTNTESQNVDKLTNYRQKSRRRKSKEDLDSQRSSQHGTSAFQPSQQHHGSRKPGTERHPVDLDRDDSHPTKTVDFRSVPRPGFEANACSDHSSEQPTAKRLKVAAVESGREFGFLAKQVPDRKLNVETVQSIRNRERHSTPREQDLTPSFNPSKARIIPTDVPLAKIFKRDGTLAKTPVRKTAKERMQPESKLGRAGPIDERASSDELNGPATVPSRGSRSMSQQKRLQPSNGQQRPPSPSDIQRTKFKSTKQASNDAKQLTKKVDDYPDSDGDNDFIPISGLFMRACQLKDGDIRLIPHHEDLDWMIEHNEEFVKHPQTSEPLLINSKIVSALKYGIGTSSKVIVQSPNDGWVTEQAFCIHFDTRVGMEEWTKRLWNANGGKTSYSEQEKPDDWIEKAFIKCMTAALDKEKNDPIAVKSSRQPFVEEQPNRREFQFPRIPTEDEQIIYEAEAEEQPTRRRHDQTAMQRLLSDEVNHEGRVVSRHFKPPQRKSVRERKPTKPRTPTPPPSERWTHIHKPKAWNHSVVYPPTGAKRITIDFQDLERLDEGEFLNDNVIGFALRHLEEQYKSRCAISDELETVHFFNTYFYTALTTSKKGTKGFNYDAVKRWTKGVDLLETPFVVVPINLDLHWFVAIICNLPNVERKAVGLEDEEEGKPAGPEVQANFNTFLGPVVQSSQPGDKVARGSPQTDDKKVAKAVGGLSLDDDVLEEDEAQPRLRQSSVFHFSEDGKVQADENIDFSEIRSKQTETGSRSTAASDRKPKRKSAPPKRTYEPDAPVIITLDSFGSTHNIEIRNLKDYLTAEAEAKRGMNLSRSELQGVTAKGLPEQTNFCDCGVYLLGYVEKFLEDPRAFVNKVLSRELDRGKDFEDFDPVKGRDKWRTTLLELEKRQNEEKHARKREAHYAKTAPAVQARQKKAPSVDGANPNASNGLPITATREAAIATTAESYTQPGKDGSVAGRKPKGAAPSNPFGPPSAQASKVRANVATKTVPSDASTTKPPPPKAADVPSSPDIDDSVERGSIKNPKKSVQNEIDQTKQRELNHVGAVDTTEHADVEEMDNSIEIIAARRLPDMDKPTASETLAASAGKKEPPSDVILDSQYSDEMLDDPAQSQKQHLIGYATSTEPDEGTPLLDGLDAAIEGNNHDNSLDAAIEGNNHDNSLDTAPEPLSSKEQRPTSAPGAINLDGAGVDADVEPEIERTSEVPDSQTSQPRNGSQGGFRLGSTKGDVRIKFDFH